MVSQRRYASSRHSSIQAGSFFFAEMKRTVSSDRPFGALSDSISVSNPYLYWSTSMRRTCSTVSCTAGIRPSAHGFKDRGLDEVGYGDVLADLSSAVTPLWPLNHSNGRKNVRQCSHLGGNTVRST